MSHSESREDAADGDELPIERSPLEDSSREESTRGDRYRRRLDTTVLTPFRIVWSDSRARVGLLIILFYLLMGTVGVMILEAPVQGEGGRLVGPFQSWQFPLGTDTGGEGILKQIVYATPPMLLMIGSGAVFSTVMATLVGTFSGYKGGNVDRVLMSFTDIALAIPGLPLIIVISVVLEPRSPIVIGIVLSINAWAGLARSIRSQVLTLRSESYVEASRVMGESVPFIIRGDILPNIMPYVLINFVRTGRYVVFASVGLYFLGVLPSSTENWGIMMEYAYSTAGALYTLESAHWLFFPMLAIVVLVFGLTMFSQGTDRLFNPRVRARHSDDVGNEEEN
jgi:peptide/nickel transport system permease protein